MFSYKYKPRAKVLILLSMLFFLSLFQSFAKGASEIPRKGPINVGSKIDTEGALLGNMIALILQSDGFAVEDRIETGTTPIVREAIITGELDIYPEYTGNGYYFFSGESEEAPWKNPTSAYETIKILDYQANNIVWLTPAPANNTWAIALQGDLAASQGLTTLEDLSSYLNAGGEFKIAASEEFVSSPAALPSFEAGYGFKLTNDQMLVLSSGNTALTEQAAANGTDGVNAAMAYGTDGQLATLGLKVMIDTLGVQPVYQPAPIIREEVLLAYPEIEELLKPVFLSLDLEILQELNGRIAVSGEEAALVAEEYLKSKGFL